MLVNRRVATIGSVAVVWFVAVTITAAAELKPKTIAAFDHYVGLNEARIQSEVSGEQPFLWVDRSSPDERTQLYDRLNRGEVLVERLETREGDRKISIPSGLVHHWIGTVLIPGVSLESTIALVRDYERYAEFYGPNIQKASILEQDGDRFKVYAQLYMKKVLTAVLDTEYDAQFVTVDDRRAYVPSWTTRIVEVEHHNSPEERLKPEGNDRGFLWRFNNYCSFEQRDEGTYMQCESVSLSRGLPFLIGAIVKPFVTGIPKETMTFTLTAARERFASDATRSGESRPSTSGF